MERGTWHDLEPVDVGPGHPRLGLDAQKKTLGTTERDEPQRQACRARIVQRAADDFVIVDEMGSNINLTPRYGRAPRGQRAYGHVPRNTPPNTTLIAALTTDGIGAALVLEGAVDTVAFELYVAQVLVPTLSPGKIVVFDNLSAHKNPRIRELIEGCGCEVWPLPSYSPDLSPIEEAFSKLKQGLRRVGARTQELLIDAIAIGLNMITPADARGYFTHCGYQVA